MVRVSVRPLGPWQMILGPNSREVDVKGKTLRELIESLDKVSAGVLKKEVLTETGSLNPRFRIYINGESCDEHGLDTPISDGDNIMLFSVIDGG